MLINFLFPVATALFRRNSDDAYLELAARLIEELQHPNARSTDKVQECCESACGGFIGANGGCNAPFAWNQRSVRCRACVNGPQAAINFCTNPPAGFGNDCFMWARNLEIKREVGDQVCVMMGKMNSLLEAFQAEVAEQSDTICYDGNWGSNTEFIDEIRAGNVDAGALDLCWANIVGNQANMGLDQWEKAYLIAKQKLNIKSFLDELFEDIDDYTNPLATRRRADNALEDFRRRAADPWDQMDDFADGGVSGAWSSGNSALLNRLAENAGKTMDACDAYLVEPASSGLRNPGRTCYAACGASGPCDYCGTGKCCEAGEVVNGCTGAGGEGRRVCVAASH